MRFNFYALFLITFFSYLPTVYAQAPCGTVDHPETKAYWQAHDLAYSKWLRANPQWNSRLPERMFIQPHIVTRTDGTGGVSLVDFYDAINFTTLQYLKANIAIQVCDINYIANDQAYDYVLPTSEDFLLGFNVPNRINIYFVSNPRTVSSDQGYVCGYTYRPGGPKIIIMANNCTANGTTLAHEIGHYMSLYHTHGTTNNGTTNELVDGSNCGTAGDRICDTPADPNLSGQVDANCVYTGSDRDANGMLFQPDPSNIMAYSPDRCQDYFSEGQLSLMAFTLQGVRDELLADAPCGGDFGDCLTVTTTDDYGYGSLRIAIGCANQNPGPDTIRFRFPAGASPTILLNEALPTLTDDGTVIDASLPNSGPEARVNLSGRNMLAEGDGMLNIEGQKIEVLNLGFKEYRIGASGGSTEIGAIQVGDSAADFRLENVQVEFSPVGLKLGTSYGTITKSAFKFCQFAIRFSEGASAISITETDYLCNRRRVWETESELTNLPGAPTVSGVSGGLVSGKSEAGNYVEVFANRDGGCQGAPCQGEYLGFTYADANGDWSMPTGDLILASYTANTTVIKNGKAYTSEFANCVALLEEVNFWIYPNPVTDAYLNFELKGQLDSLQVRILNSIGQQVFYKEFAMQNTEIKETLDIGEWLAAGVYVFELKKGTSIFRQKILIQ